MLAMFLFHAVLFFLLVPGILLSLPPGSGLITRAAFHAIVFAVIIQLTHKTVWKLLHA